MGTRILVDDRYYPAETFLTRLVRSGIDVQAAFWLTTGDEETNLYIVSKVVDEKGLAAAYREVNALLRRTPESRVMVDDVKLIGPSHPIAVDVAAILKLYSGRLPIRVPERLLGGMVVRDVYIYPPHLFSAPEAARMTRDEVSSELIRLMNRGPGLLSPSRIVLRDGAVFHGVPFSLSLNAQQALVAQFVVEGEAAPRTVLVDEIDSID